MEKEKYLLVFTNAKGKAISRTLDNEDEVVEWSKMLDKRIGRGTCGGYLITKFVGVR